MILSILMALILNANQRFKSSNCAKYLSDFKRNHIIDYDRNDPQTKEWLKNQEKKDEEEDDEPPEEP